MMKRFWCAGGLLLCCYTVIAQAAVPQTIHYQGKLTEPDGTPVVGEHTVTMRFYDALTGGTQLWDERHVLNFLPEDEGVLSLDLGSRTPFEGLVSFSDPVFLSIEIDTGGEPVPRQALTAVGYALNADRLDGASVGTTPGSIVRLDAAGANITLSQSGQTITVAASGAGTPGNQVTSFASAALAIGTAADTTLLSVTITKAQANSALLLLATVQLNHVSGAKDKTVDVKLFRDATQLDANYTARLGTEDGTVRNLPVGLHTVDASGTGTFTFTLRARSTGAGAQATIRRLTVIEVL